MGVAAHSRQGLMSPLRKGQESVFYLPSFLQANTCVFVSLELAVKGPGCWLGVPSRPGSRCVSFQKCGLMSSFI